MKHLYLIGGPMGVGKTTVCQQLKQTLPYSVFLDGDWCWDASPFQVTPETRAMVLDNICHLLNNFLACTAYQNVVFCWVLHQQDIWDTILGRLHLESCAAHCVALTASEAALRQRLEADVAAGRRTGVPVPGRPRPLCPDSAPVGRGAHHAAAHLKRSVSFAVRIRS